MFGNGNDFVNSSKAPFIYGFDDEIYFDANGSRVVDSAEDLKDALENGNNVVLGGDINLDDLFGSFGG